MNSKLAVLGCGAWATTIANHLCKNGYDVNLWAYKQEIVDEINGKRIRKKIPNIILEPNLKAFTSLNDVIQNANAIILCVPSKFLARTLELWKPYYDSKIPILSLIKGIASENKMLLTDYLKSIFSDAKLAVLSGPNLASEISLGKPAASVVASKDIQIANLFQKYLASESLRIYTSTDVIGVFCGGIIKNIISIAAGSCDSLELGYNAKATLITRGLNEMVRFGEFMGAKKETFYGLSGLGDLVATAHSPLSRNYQFGFKLAASQNSNGANQEFNEIAEGVHTTKKLAKFAKENNLDLPIIDTINNVLCNNLSIKVAIQQLMTRKLKEE